MKKKIIAIIVLLLVALLVTIFISVYNKHYWHSFEPDGENKFLIYKTYSVDIMSVAGTGGLKYWLFGLTGRTTYSYTTYYEIDLSEDIIEERVSCYYYSGNDLYQYLVSYDRKLVETINLNNEQIEELRELINLIMQDDDEDEGENNNENEIKSASSILEQLKTQSEYDNCYLVTNNNSENEKLSENECIKFYEIIEN